MYKNREGRSSSTYEKWIYWIEQKIFPCNGPQTTTSNKVELCVSHILNTQRSPFLGGYVPSSDILDLISVPYMVPLGFRNMQFVKCNILSKKIYAQLGKTFVFKINHFY